jgi:hypothetical protein
MDKLQPGPTGVPLPPGEWVLRIAAVPKDFQETGQMNPEVFALSTEDRLETPPRLSVWAEKLTTPEQAWLFMGGRPNYRLALRLNVDAIRTLRPNPELPDVPNLDVQWHVLRDEDARADARPGAEGHAGITGLEAGSAAQRKSFRRKLARLASQDVHWIAPPAPDATE